MRKRKIYAYILLCTIGINLIPQHTFALTGGPSQPEVESFKPIEVTDMVDPASGDFSYNIPLLEVCLLYTSSQYQCYNDQYLAQLSGIDH